MIPVPGCTANVYGLRVKNGWGTRCIINTPEMAAVPQTEARLVCLDRQSGRLSWTVALSQLPDEAQALQCFEAEFRPVVLTDSAEVVRKIRARSALRAPYILYVAELDESASVASYDNGVLELKLVKKAAVAGKRLTIR